MRDRLPELHAALLAADSATEVLERLFGAPVVARRVGCDPVEPAAEQRGRLELGACEAWAHRRVILAAQGRPVSQADLWYVPHRLEPSMIHALETTDRPFGHVVRPLRPVRSTLSASLSGPPERQALEHRALLTILVGTRPLPIAEVHERYGFDPPAMS